MTVLNPEAEVTWIDLDKVMPAALRADLARMTAEIEDFAPVLDEKMRQAHRVFTQADAAIMDAVRGVPADDVYNVLHTMTGLADLVTALTKLLDPIHAAYGDSRRTDGSPQWAQDPLV